MNAGENDARSRLHSWIVNVQSEGVEYRFWRGGERKGTNRKAKGRAYTSRGKQRNSGQCLIPTIIYTTLFQCMSVRLSQFSVQVPLFRLRWVLSVVSSAARRGLTVSRSHRTSRRHSTGEKSCCWQKRGTTSGVVKRRGHTPVHKAPGQRNGAIVLQLRASRDGSGSLPINVRVSLHRGRGQSS